MAEMTKHQHKWIEKFRVTEPNEAGKFILQIYGGQRFEREVPSIYYECECGDSQIAPIPPSEEHYLAEDLIITDLELPRPCPIHIDLYADRIELKIGSREFGWKRGQPDLNYAGTWLDGREA